MNTVLFGGADTRTALEHVAWAGYKYVELAAIQGMCEHVKIGDDVSAVKALLHEFGLQVTAMEAATTERDRLRGLFGLAREVGIGIVAIGSGGKTGDEDSVKSSIALIRDLAKLASDSGVRLAVKPHVGSAIHDSATGLRLVNEGAEPALDLNFDPDRKSTRLKSS